MVIRPEGIIAAACKDQLQVSSSEHQILRHSGVAHVNPFSPIQPMCLLQFNALKIYCHGCSHSFCQHISSRSRFPLAWRLCIPQQEENLPGGSERRLCGCWGKLENQRDFGGTCFISMIIACFLGKGWFLTTTKGKQSLLPVRKIQACLQISPFQVSIFHSSLSRPWL